MLVAQYLCSNVHYCDKCTNYTNGEAAAGHVEILYYLCNFSIDVKSIPLKNVLNLLRDFPGGSDGKASAYNAGDPGLIPGSGKSSGEGNGNPLQYSYLENPMDGGAW